jgi:hypothetical protein
MQQRITAVPDNVATYTAVPDDAATYTAVPATFSAVPDDAAMWTAPSKGRDTSSTHHKPMAAYALARATSGSQADGSQLCANVYSPIARRQQSVDSMASAAWNSSAPVLLLAAPAPPCEWASPRCFGVGECTVHTKAGAARGTLLGTEASRWLTRFPAGVVCATM